jgi:predicted PurR-regulated permease PerM
MTDLSRRCFILASIILLGYLIYLLKPVLTPFAIAALLAYLFDPLADRLEAWGLSRTLAVVIVFTFIVIIMAAVLLILVPLLESQISRLIHNLPAYFEWLSSRLSPWLKKTFGIEVDLFDTQALTELLKQHWDKAGGLAAAILRTVSQSSAVIVHWLTNLFLIPVITFYLLRDWDILTARVGELVPRTIYPTVSRLVKEANEVLSAFLRGQLTVMLVLGLIYAIGLKLAGIDLAFLIGMTAGILSFVPYLGTITGLLMALFAAATQYGDPQHFIYVLIVFGIGQLLEGMVLTPWLVGDRIGLHPVAVIFAVLAGGQLFGFVGVLLGLPLAAVIMVLVRHAHERYLQSSLYGKADDREIALSAETVGANSADPAATSGHSDKQQGQPADQETDSPA